MTLAHIALSQTGAQIASTWDPNVLNKWCTTPGTMTVKGKVLDMHVSGAVGNCVQLTYTARTFRYGEFSAQVKVTWRAGDDEPWFAAWSVGSPEKNWPKVGEADWAEGLQQWGNGFVVCPTYHYYDRTAVNHDGASPDHCQPYEAGWNTYAVWWAPRELSFYYDGKLVLRLRERYIVSAPWLLKLTITNHLPEGPSDMYVRQVTVRQ